MEMGIPYNREWICMGALLFLLFFDEIDFRIMGFMFRRVHNGYEFYSGKGFIID